MDFQHLLFLTLFGGLLLLFSWREKYNQFKLRDYKNSREGLYSYFKVKNNELCNRTFAMF